MGSILNQLGSISLEGSGIPTAWQAHPPKGDQACENGNMEAMMKTSQELIDWVWDLYIDFHHGDLIDQEEAERRSRAP